MPDRAKPPAYVVICICSHPWPLDWPHYQPVGAFTCARCGGQHA